MSIIPAPDEYADSKVDMFPPSRTDGTIIVLIAVSTAAIINPYAGINNHQCIRLMRKPTKNHRAIPMRIGTPFGWVWNKEVSSLLRSIAIPAQIKAGRSQPHFLIPSRKYVIANARAPQPSIKTQFSVDNFLKPTLPGSKAMPTRKRTRAQNM